MQFSETPIAGVTLVDVIRINDDRGFFGRIWCRKEFEAYGLDSRAVQINTALSHRAGTVRGMHYQESPHSETKVIRCTRGKVYDIALDLRPSSSTFRQWFGVELSPDNQRILVIPPGCAHGYQSLEDCTELMYLTSEFYAPHAVRGVRYDDPAFTVTWPLPVSLISQQDATWPVFDLHGS